MPIKHSIDSGLLIVERTGHISTHDEQGALETRMKDPKIISGIPVLVDCRKVEPADSTDVIQFLADNITIHAQHLKCGPLAIVVSTAVEYGMARMYQILTEVKHPNTKIFRSIDNDRQWLLKRSHNKGHAV